MVRTLLILTALTLFCVPASAQEEQILLPIIMGGTAAPPAGGTDSVKFVIAGDGAANVGNQVTFALNVGAASNRLLIAQIRFKDGDAVARPVATAVTYNTVALTRYQYDANNADLTHAEVWYLVNPAAGSNTLTVDTDSTMEISVGASAWYNCAQSSPLADWMIEAVKTDSVVDVANTSVRDIVIASRFNNYAAPYEINPLATQLHSLENSDDYLMSAYIRPSGASTQIIFRNVPVDDWQYQYGFRIKPTP